MSELKPNEGGCGAQAARVLVVDDDADLCEVMELGLRHRGYDVAALTSPLEALRLIGNEQVDVLVTDLNMRELDGMTLCERALAMQPGIAVIVITAFGSLETAVRAIRAGAYDFITKPVELDVVALALSRAVELRRLRIEVKRLREAGRETRSYAGLVGNSPAMQRVFDLLARIAGSDASVLVTGESGTGKELVARALHEGGRRREGPFVAINCAAIPETLLESELFGHERGAFTGAGTAQQGLLALADGGTVFLDEVGEMPLEMQAKLLRALQERRARPVGGRTEVPFDVRIVASTNRDLEDDISTGRFRDDLYFRLNVIQIELPPLRSRGSDILLLAQHILERKAAAATTPVTGFTAEAAQKLMAYDWPGNVRELENCVERAVALATFEMVTVDDLPQRIVEYRRSHVVVMADDPSELVTLAEVERRYVLRVLEAVGGHRAHAARILGLDRKTLYRKLEAWDKTAPDGASDG